MKEETNNSTGIDLCIWCCFPCLFLCMSIEKCFQSSFLCCCQILTCECKTTANEKISNRDLNNNQIDNSNGHDYRESEEDDFTEIITSNESIRSTNKDLIVSLISEQIPEITDDERKLLRNAIQEYKFDYSYEFNFYGKTKFVKYKNSKEIDWSASINNQTMDIAECWSKYDRSFGISDLIDKYK